MKWKKKRAKVVSKYRIVCPYCAQIKDASPWAVAHWNVDIEFICRDCGKKSIIKAHTLRRY